MSPLRQEERMTSEGLSERGVGRGRETGVWGQPVTIGEISRASPQKDALQGEQETGSAPRTVDFDLWRVWVLRNGLINHNLYNQGLRCYVSWSGQWGGPLTRMKRKLWSYTLPGNPSGVRMEGAGWTCSWVFGAGAQTSMSAAGRELHAQAQLRVDSGDAGQAGGGGPWGTVWESVFCTQGEVSPNKSYHFLSVFYVASHP